MISSVRSSIVIEKENQNDHYTESGPIVLIIDDDIINIEVIRGMLDTKSIQSDFALTGLQALMMIKEKLLKPKEPQYKVIILDQ